MKNYKSIFNKKNKIQESSFEISYDQCFDEIINRYKNVLWMTYYTKEPNRMDIKNLKVKPLSGNGLSFSNKDFIFETSGKNKIKKCLKDDNQSWVKFDSIFNTDNQISIGMK